MTINTTFLEKNITKIQIKCQTQEILVFHSHNNKLNPLKVNLSSYEPKNKSKDECLRLALKVIFILN